MSRVYVTHTHTHAHTQTHTDMCWPLTNKENPAKSSCLPSSSSTLQVYLASSFIFVLVRQNVARRSLSSNDVVTRGSVFIWIKPRYQLTRGGFCLNQHSTTASSPSNRNKHDALAGVPHVITNIILAHTIFGYTAYTRAWKSLPDPRVSSILSFMRSRSRSLQVAKARALWLGNISA